MTAQLVRKLLVANRGEIACRVMRTAQALGVATVAVYSDPDRDAPHVELADEAIALGGTAAAENYLHIEALLDAASRTGADAVHPGYGFLSESAGFARACRDAGLTFVGPSPEAMEEMSDKLRAKELMRDAGVPVLEAVEVTAETDLDQAAATVGWPVLVKAASGGGGKGMRVVGEDEDLGQAVDAARREAEAAFGDPTVFLERYLSQPRHIEVQILGDTVGTVVHLGERECSIQRRHQKIVEESPSPAVDEKLRDRLGSAAVAAGQALGYENAGTVEFVADQAGEFYFLEVNTRLQVEHPVTEAAWGIGDAGELDLVRLQLSVARGEPLEFAQDDLTLRNHAVEARLYAEDPAAGFLPATGTLAVWELATPPGVRADEGVRAGSEIGTAYDPMLAKVIAAAPARTDAALLLARALEQSRIHGVTTNRDFLAEVLAHEAFLAGETHTGFIDEHLATDESRRQTDRRALATHAVAAALVGAHERLRALPVLKSIRPGWRNNRSQLQHTAYDTAHDTGEDEPVEVRYGLERDGAWTAMVDDAEHRVLIGGWPDEREDGCLDLAVDGHRLRARVATDGTTAYVDSPLGHATLVERPRFTQAEAEEIPGGLDAPMPGTATIVEVNEGQQVTRGDLLIVLEAMKMEHRVTAPYDGEVSEVRVTAGAGVDAGDILVVIEQADADEAEQGAAVG
jgi:acetyl/propionyl-CoA carboxylase alpha subunit